MDPIQLNGCGMMYILFLVDMCDRACVFLVFSLVEYDVREMFDGIK